MALSGFTNSLTGPSDVAAPFTVARKCCNMPLYRTQTGQPAIRVGKEGVSP